MKKFWEDEEYVEEKIFEEEFFEEELEEEIFEEEFFEDQPEENTLKKYLVTGTLSISSEPGVGRLLGHLHPGEIEVLEELDNWVRVEQGWVNKHFLRIVE